jgi:HAD superfamily hydrolase (TIGR01549 family)
MNKFEEVEVIIFDYGNTLIYDPFIDILTDDFLRFVSFKVNRSREKVRDALIKANREINYPHATHFAQEEPMIWHALETLGIDAPSRLFLSLEILRKYREGYKKVIKRYVKKGEIKSIFEYLFKKGKRLGIISNGRTVDLYTVLELLKIRKYCEFTLSSEEFGIEKPDKRIFTHMLKLFKIPAKKALYVGDDPTRDTVPTKILGMKMILCKPPKKYAKPLPWRKYNVKIKKKPDLVIKNLSDLKKIF